MAIRTGLPARPRGVLTPAGLTARAALLGLLALVAPLGLGLGVVGTAGPAQADVGDRIVYKTDPRGDVADLPRKGAGAVARASIDLRSVLLTQEADGVQVTVTLKRILTDSRFTQDVEVTMKPAEASQRWFLDVTMDGLEPASASASYAPDLSGQHTLCGDLPTTVDPDSDTLTVTVPGKCLPTEQAKIRVFSSLTGGPGGAFSVDKLAVRGRYLMRG